MCCSPVGTLFLSFPLVSGFYKLLAVTMKIANKLHDFQVPVSALIIDFKFTKI